MPASQELYTAMLLKLRSLWPDSVFDGDLPPDGTPYPFVHLGDTQDIAEFLVKGAAFGRMSITVNIWMNNPRRRGDLSLMAFKTKALARSISETDSFGWCLSGCEESVIPDNTTKDPLMHGVLIFEYKYWRKK